MREREQDQALLAMLNVREREAIRKVMEDFIGNQLGASSPHRLQSVADAFDDHALLQRPPERFFARVFAAMLRSEAAGEF